MKNIFSQIGVFCLCVFVLVCLLFVFCGCFVIMMICDLLKSNWSKAVSALLGYLLGLPSGHGKNAATCYTCGMPAKVMMPDTIYNRKRGLCSVHAKVLLLLFSISVNAEPVLTPVFRDRGHLGIAAYWSNPTNEIWIAEFSTNLVTWQRTGNETCYSTSLCFTETGLGWTHQIFFRLRRLP